MATICPGRAMNAMAAHVVAKKHGRSDIVDLSGSSGRASKACEPRNGLSFGS